MARTPDRADVQLATDSADLQSVPKNTSKYKIRSINLPDHADVPLATDSAYLQSVHTKNGDNN